MNSRRAFGAIGLIAVVVGVIWLRQVTMSRSNPTPPDSRTVVVVEPRTNLSDPAVTLEEIASAVMTSCRLEVNSEPSAHMSTLDGQDRFRLVLEPALNKTERRRYEGCLKDWSIDHLRIEVISIEQIGTGES